MFALSRTTLTVLEMHDTTDNHVSRRHLAFVAPRWHGRVRCARGGLKELERGAISAIAHIRAARLRCECGFTLVWEASRDSKIRAVIFLLDKAS